MKAIATLAKAGLTTIFVVLMPVIAFVLISSKTSLIPGIKSFTVVTGSMTPTIPVGSIVVMQKASQYHVGDVITFKRGDIDVTHRIVAVVDKSGGAFYQTKGDANNGADPQLVPKSVVVGRGLFQITYAGRILMWLKTMPGFLVVIVLPALMFVGTELWNIKKEIEKETEKRVLEKIKATGSYAQI